MMEMSSTEEKLTTLYLCNKKGILMTRFHSLKTMGENTENPFENNPFRGMDLSKKALQSLG